jgi:two-component system CitB family sensor kinase/two-component system sensor histidine kinase DcuS
LFLRQQVPSIFEHIDRLLPRSLQLKLSLLVTGLLVLLVSLIGALFSDFTSNILQQQIGSKTLALARSVALNPIVRQGLAAGDPAGIQALTEEVRGSTGAEFIVVADRQGIRYSHPDPQRIGKPFIGGDFERAVLEGATYVSRATGTLGPSLRGFVPVRGEGGEVLGFVAVGYLLRDIEAEVRSQQREILGYVAVVLFFGVFGAIVIAKGLKAAIFGLEPHAIAALFQERNAIIGAIREGVVAVDGDGRLTLVNQAARSYLGRNPLEDLRGRPLAEICPCPEMERALAGGERILDEEMPLAGRTMLVNVLPLGGEGAAAGAVASFRPKDELDRLTRELSHMQEYSELLRAQTHEYSNKLHTIAGLIQIGAHQEALELIMTEASGYQELIRTLARAVPDPVVAGLILGKFNRARELKIDFSLDSESTFTDLPSHLEREQLVTVLGNLLDNAFEAVREMGGEGGVRLFLTDLGSDLIIEVEDSGRGVSPAVADRLFEKGVTTHRSAGRGMGLYLLRRALDALGGEITFAKGELGGALFTVIIPKNKDEG